MFNDWFFYALNYNINSIFNFFFVLYFNHYKKYKLQKRNMKNNELKKKKPLNNKKLEEGLDIQQIV